MSSLVFRERPAAGVAEGLLVLHHGRGADEQDLLGLADVLDPEQRLHVVTPGGPLSYAIPGQPWASTGTWFLASGIRTLTPSTLHTRSSQRFTTSSGSKPGSSPAAPCLAASRWAR